MMALIGIRTSFVGTYGRFRIIVRNHSVLVRVLIERWIRGLVVSGVVVVRTSNLLLGKLLLTNLRADSV